MRRLPAALLLLSSTSSNLVTYTDAFHFNRGGRRALLLSAAPSRSPHDGSCAVDEDLKPDESCVEALVDSLTVEEYAFDAGENGEESFDADISAALATLQAALEQEALMEESGDLSTVDSMDSSDDSTSEFISTCFEEELDTLTQPGLGEQPSNLFVPLHPVDGKPLRLEPMIYVEEANCIGCRLCADIAPDTFMMERERGRGRAYQQNVASAEVLQEVITSCPTRCIYEVSWEELVDYETRREDRSSETTSTGRPRQVTGSEFPWQSKGSALESACYGSTGCPKNGCFNCPLYTSPGGNPHYHENKKALIEERRHHSNREFVPASYRAEL